MYTAPDNRSAQQQPGSPSDTVSAGASSLSTPTTGRSKGRWTLVLRLKRGHRYFTETTGRIAVADYSGTYPEHTEDGVLFLDPLRPLAMGATHGYVPLVRPDGSLTGTSESPEDILKLSAFFQKPINTQYGTFMALVMQATTTTEG